MKIKTILLALVSMTANFLMAQENMKEVYSKAYGSDKNPAIIFLHGGPGYNAVGFELSTAQKLADKGYYVIVYDQRGSGRSKSMKNSKFTFNEAFDDLNVVYEKYNIKEATLIGHSWGGILGTKFTEKYPEKVNNLVLVGAPVSLQESLRTILATCRKIYTEQKSPNLQYIDMLEKMDTALLEYSSYLLYHAMANRNSFYSPKTPTEEAQGIYKSLMGTPDAKYMSDMSMEPVTGFYKNEKYTTINLIPTLKNLAESEKIYGIYGNEDGLYSKEQLHSLKAITGNNNFKIIENASHNAFIDQQKEFIETLDGFIKK